MTRTARDPYEQAEHDERMSAEHAAGWHGEGDPSEARVECAACRRAFITIQRDDPDTVDALISAARRVLTSAELIASEPGNTYPLTARAMAATLRAALAPFEDGEPALMECETCGPTDEQPCPEPCEHTCCEVAHDEAGHPWHTLDCPIEGERGEPDAGDESVIPYSERDGRDI